jgi:hypothetical protein
MITTAQLIATIREANGETEPQIKARILDVAIDLGISPAESTVSDYATTWYDDDADEICLAILP